MTAPIDARCKRQLAGASLRSRRSADFITAISALPECRGSQRSDVHVGANQLGREARKPLVLVLGESVFEDDVLAFDVAELTQTGSEASERLRVNAFSGGTEKPGPIDVPGPLRVGRERDKSETDNENDREPDQPHAHLV